MVLFLKECVTDMLTDLMIQLKLQKHTSSYREVTVGSDVSVLLENTSAGQTLADSD